MVIDTNAISLELNGSEIQLEFVGSYSYIWVENIGSSTISVSRTPDIANQESGFIQRPPKSSVGIQVSNSTIYVSGTGIINVMATNSAENPFKIVGEGGGGSGPGGTTNYNDLNNKPKIGGVTLEGDKTLEDLGISQSESGGSSDVTNIQNNLHVESLTLYGPWNSFFNITTTVNFKKPMEGRYGVVMNGMFVGASYVFEVGAQRIGGGENACLLIPKTNDNYWSSRNDPAYLTIICIQNLD